VLGGLPVGLGNLRPLETVALVGDDLIGLCQVRIRLQRGASVVMVFPLSDEVLVEGGLCKLA
jgi:hypothetical protein